MVPPYSVKITRVPTYSFVNLVPINIFAYGSITLYAQSFQTVLLIYMLSLTALLPFRSPLLWESRLISLPEGTEMFHFPSFAPTEVGNMNRSMLGRPIQKSPDQSSLAAPRGLSQPDTSFIASTSQGIHLWPLISFLF